MSGPNGAGGMLPVSDDVNDSLAPFRPGNDFLQYPDFELSGCASADMRTGGRGGGGGWWHWLRNHVSVPPLIRF